MSAAIDLATIGVAIDTSGVPKARDELGRFKKGADDAADSADNLGKKTSGMGSAMRLAGAAAAAMSGMFAALKLADMVRDAAMLASRYETMGVVMRVAGNNAGYTSAQMAVYSKELEKNGISMMQARNAVVQLATANIDLGKASDIGRAAQNLAVVANTNSSDAMARMIHGIKSGEVEILRTMGLNVSFETGYKKLALQLGVNSASLTENQKVMSRTNTVLTESARFNGIYEESLTTAGKAMGSLTRYWENLQLKLGETFLPALSTIVFGFTDALKLANEEMDRMGGSGGAVESAGDMLNGFLITTFQAVMVVGANVAFVLRGIGREIGGIAAQAAAVARGDLKGAFGIGGIGDQMTADAEAARRGLEVFEKKILSIGATKAVVSKRSESQSIAEGNAARSKADAEAAAAAKAAEANSKRAGAAKKAATDYDNAVKAANQFITSLKQEAEEAGLDADQLKMLAAARAAQAAPTATLREQIMAQALATMQATNATDALAAAEKRRIDQAQADAATYVSTVDAEIAKADALDAQLKSERDAMEEYGLSGEALASLTAKRKNDTDALLMQRAAIADLIDPSLMLGDAIRRQAEAMGKLAKQGADAFNWKKQVDQQEQFWSNFEDAAHSTFNILATDGENAARRIGDSLKKWVLEMLYQMTIKKWIFQISGQSSLSGNAGGIGLSDLSSAYSAFSTGIGGGAGAAGAGGNAAAVGAWAGGSMSTANAAGSIYANSTGTGINGLLSTNGAYGTAGGAGSAGASGWMGAMTYAAWIAAAVVIANKMYSVGHDRTALGYTRKDGTGNTGSYTYGHGNTTDGVTGVGKAPNTVAMAATNDARGIWSGLGVNDKWADILSGTSRMATLVGRRLKGYGYDAQINGGNTDVKGYEFYKGGVFRGDKTMTKDVDPRDSAALTSMIEGVRTSAKAMGAAMGLSTEAVDNYTGSLRINLKGAKTAEEQNKRIGEAMDDLNLKMLNSIPGIKMTKDELGKFMESLTKMASDVGISAQGIGDILVQGMIGRMSTAQVGEQLSEMIVGGIYQSIAGGFAQQVGAVFIQQIINPIMASVMAGGAVSGAVSQASINGVLATAKNAMAQFNAVTNDAGFKGMMGDLQKMLGSMAGASTSASRGVKSYGVAASAGASAAQAAAAAAKAAAEQLKSAWSSMADSMSDEIRRLKGEVVGTSSGGMAYHQAQYAIAQAKAMAGDKTAAQMLPELSRTITDLAEENSASIGELVSVQATQINSLTATRAHIAARFGLSIPGFAEGGLHAGGVRMVGENGPEIEVTGSARYYSATQTMAMLNAAPTNTSSSDAEIRALRAEVAGLKAALVRIADNTTDQLSIAKAAQIGTRPTYTKAIA